MEILSVISFLLFYRRRVYSNVPPEALLISFLPFVSCYFRSFLIFSLSPILYLLSERKELFYSSLLFLSTSLFFLSLSEEIFPLLPFSNLSVTYGLKEEVHILISSIFLYLSLGEKKFFLDERISLIPLVLLIPPFFLTKKTFMEPEYFYENVLGNFTYSCVHGEVRYSRLVRVGDKEYHLLAVCKERCVYVYSDRNREGEVYLCGYILYRKGKVYFRYPKWTTCEAGC